MTASIAERYMIASGTTADLRAAGDDAGAVDLLIAAGWVAQQDRSTALLGAVLCRLRVEIDTLGGASDREALRHLRSLPAARAMVLARATRRANGRCGATAVPVLVDRCLDVFVAPKCPACEGRGFTGGDGLVKRTWCRPCGKSGRRGGMIGHTDAERAFADELLDHMDKCARFMGTGMARRVAAG